MTAAELDALTDEQLDAMSQEEFDKLMGPAFCGFMNSLAEMWERDPFSEDEDDGI